jgi:ABC-2 type transport system permease protein
MRETLRAAFVIARRDFAATVLSRAFLLFLLGPFFPVLMIGIFGAATAPMGAQMPTVAVIAPQDEYAAIKRARDYLQDALGPVTLVQLRHVAPSSQTDQAERVLRSGRAIAVLEGGLDHPRLVGSLGRDSGAASQVALFVANARLGGGAPPPPVDIVQTSREPSTPGPGQSLTARAGQSLLFLLTLLLAGMLLSQLIEEKSNKVIEVLAAAVPVDAIFLGKLIAMLTASLLGILVWASVGVGVFLALSGKGLSAIPVPAVGWPAFSLFAIVYFAMSYLLLGSIFLGIGAHASTAREVQTLSMPVTMGQVVIFAVASMAVGMPDSGRALAAAIFPLSSPYVMIARAAEVRDWWPHLAAILWQIVWVAIILRIASRLFRRSVLKSGPVRASRRKAASV